MYSYEDRMRAVELYIQYGKRGAATVQHLGYPSVKQLRRWYRCYIKTGDLPPDRTLPGNSYSPEKRRAAVDHYLQTGRCVAHTIRALGYPDGGTLRSWLNEDLGPTPQSQGRGAPKRHIDDKRQAVYELCTRQTSAKAVAQRYGVTDSALYNWRE